jgi:hypothetical protein
LDQQRKDSGFDQEALEEAACTGFANGTFEDLVEDVPAVVEEFYPGRELGSSNATAAGEVTAGLRGRLDDKVARLGPG